MQLLANAGPVFFPPDLFSDSLLQDIWPLLWLYMGYGRQEGTPPLTPRRPLLLFLTPSKWQAGRRVSRHKEVVAPLKGVIWEKHADNNDLIITQENNPETTCEKRQIRNNQTIVLQLCYIICIYLCQNKGYETLFNESSTHNKFPHFNRDWYQSEL